MIKRNNVIKGVGVGVCVCFPLSRKLCFPVAILLVVLWQVAVDTFHLGKEVGMMQEKFPPAMGVGAGEEPGKQTLWLAAQEQDQTNILAIQVGDDPEKNMGLRNHEVTQAPPSTHLLEEENKRERNSSSGDPITQDEIMLS